MKYSIVLLGTLALLAACTRDRGAEPGSTTTTGAGTAASDAKPATVEEVRIAILDHNPTGTEALSAVTITSDNGVVTLHGQVADDESRQNMVNRVKRMPNVKSVHDELQVAPKMGQTGQPELGQTGQPATAATQTGQIGTTTTTGADDTWKLQGSTKTKATDAVRAGIMKDKAALAAIVNQLIITDDGSVIILRGTVPDDKTHDALMKSAQKSAGSERVQDRLDVKK